MEHLKISVVHATARLPDGWKSAMLNLFDKARYPFYIEYILVVDDPTFQISDNDTLLVNKVVYTDLSNGLDGCVRAYNSGAKHTTGDVIILHSDDMYVPQNWDEQLVSSVENKVNEDYVVQCKTENPDLITFQILSRRRYEKLGYALHPGYHSLWADNEFTEHARLDNCIIQCPMVVEHRHPIYQKAPWDEVYAKENKFAWAEHGRNLFNKRKALGFPY